MKDSLNIHQRLLDAASEVFARKGYKEGTVAEICKKADANIAAVNYHFRSKENLYVEAWRDSFRKSKKNWPSENEFNANIPAENRLRLFIKSLVARITDKNSNVFSILHKEMSNPTGLLLEIQKKEIKPEIDALEKIIQELLGPHITSREIRFCQVSIMSQCFHFMRFRQDSSNTKTPPNPIGINEIDAFTDHIVNFSLAGIQGIRNSKPKKTVSEEGKETKN